MSVGFRVYMKRNMPPRELVEAFRSIPAANVADCMGRHFAMHPEIRRMTLPGELNMAGAALTVKTCYGDNLMIHQAFDMAVEGDVVVVSNEGGRNRSLMGEIMFEYAKRKGIAGIVLDGPLRDAGAIAAGGLPVYATGSTPGGPYKEGPGEVNVPVSCGGVEVHPGDIVVGDEDGVIVIPRRDAERVLREAQAFQKSDTAKLQAAIDGTADRSWVRKQLDAKKCEFLDEAY